MTTTATAVDACQLGARRRFCALVDRNKQSTQVDNIKGATSGIVPDRPGSGTYRVHADCSGTTRFVPGPGVLIEERFVIVDYGHEIRSITTSPQPAMISTIAKRTGFL